jgi:hypothetical protein
MTLKELSALKSLDALMHATVARILEIEVHAPGSANEKAELEKRVRQYADERRRILAYINGVEDRLVRAILTLRIVNSMTWADVAEAIGGKNTEASVKMACYRFLRQG